MKRYEIDGMIFLSLTDAINYCEEENLSEEDISEYEGDIEAYCKEHPEDPECKRHRKEIHEEEAVIEDNPEESPDEDGEVLEERTLVEKLAVEKALETFGEWDDTAKAEIIQQALSVTDKTREKPARLKGAPKHSTIESYVKDQYQKLVEVLADSDTKVCPICSRPFEEELSTEQLSFWKPDLTPIKGRPDTYEKQSKKHDPKLPKVLENQFPRIRLIHIKTKHPAIWEFIKTMFEVPKEMPNVVEPFSSNPEACSEENLEELSREELTAEVVKSPELRKQLFHIWKRKLER